MPFNLGSYYHQYDSNDNSKQYSNIGAPLSWRQPKDDSFSDWTIIAKDGDIATHYYVHRVQLGVGPRRSEYFSRIFHMEGLAEAENKTSEVILEHSAADAFPIMLDYIYSHEGNLNATTELATALRYLSNYFGICDLFLRVNEFIQNDLTMEKVPIYWKEASLYKDETLYVAMVPLIAENFENQEIDILLEMNSSQFCDIVTSPQLKCGSEFLSKAVAEYLKTHSDQITGDLLFALTCPKKMPHLAPETAMFFLNLDNVYLRNFDETKKENTLFCRCVDAFMRTDFRSIQKTTKKQEDYEKLSKNVRIELLEESLHRSYQKNHQLKTKNIDMNNKNQALEHWNCVLENRNQLLEIENHTLKNKYKVVANAFPKCVIVHGAGVASVNGVYHRSGKTDNCEKYTKKEVRGGKEKVYALYRHNSKRWAISFWPRDESHKEIYRCRKSNETPPRHGWVSKGGVDPPPTCHLSLKIGDIELRMLEKIHQDY